MTVGSAPVGMLIPTMIEVVGRHGGKKLLEDIGGPLRMPREREPTIPILGGMPIL